MTLEPTEVQLEAMARMFAESQKRDAELGGARMAFVFVRDIVLEEAATACERLAREALDLERADRVPKMSIRGHTTNGYAAGCLTAAEAIRGLKGNP